MHNCISCGKFNKIYLFIILAYLLLSTVSSTLYYIVVYPEDSSDSKDNPVFKLFILYFMNSLLFIPELILNKYFFENEKEIQDSNKQKTALIIEYIFNDSSNMITFKDKIIIFIISIIIILIDASKFIFFKLLKEYADQIIYNEYYYVIELLFLFLLSIFIYKVNFYKHQYASIIIIIILGIIRLLINAKYLVDFLGNIGRLFLIIFIQILIALFSSFIFVYIKSLMEYKYFSPFKCCYLFGIIDTIIVLIAYFIISFLPCEKSYCKVSYKNKNYLLFFLLFSK